MTNGSSATRTDLRRRRGFSKLEQGYMGFFLILPWLIGFCVFKLYPFISSLVYSFTDYDLFKGAQHFVGFQNYIDAFTKSKNVKALQVTFAYAFMTVPLKLIFALFIAYILNFKIKGVGLFRTAYYVPSILGGAKVSDKLNVINNLLEKVDTLIIGGGMAYTFLAAKGYAVGKSLLDESKIDYCKDMMAKAEAKGVKLLLPVDVVVADSFPDPIDGPIDVTTVDAAAIPADKEGLDIGEKTCALFASAVKDAKTVVWNGPMGVFENPTLAKGTIAMAQALADSSATTIVGGGDSAAACEQLGFADKITHISTGGGASLEFLEGLELPGIACLQDK